MIDIPESYYERCKDYVQAEDADYHHKAIANGTPLLKEQKSVTGLIEEIEKLQKMTAVFGGLSKIETLSAYSNCIKIIKEYWGIDSDYKEKSEVKENANND